VVYSSVTGEMPEKQNPPDNGKQAMQASNVIHFLF
jgi:hypothetical protein